MLLLKWIFIITLLLSVSEGWKKKKPSKKPTGGGGGVTQCPPAGSLSNSPKGIIIKVSDAYQWSIDYLDEWLTNICARNVILPTNQKMTDLVLQDIAIENIRGCMDPNIKYTIDYKALDIIAPYFPGAPKSCFINLFIGTINLYWNGQPHPYDGATNETFRDKMVDFSTEIGQSFKDKYPTTNFNWFITHSKDLYPIGIGEAIWLSSYIDLFTRLIKAFNGIQPGNIMYNPSISVSYDTVNSNEEVIAMMKKTLQQLFTSVKMSASPGTNWLNLKDTTKPDCMPCQSNFFGPPNTLPDTINWFNWLKGTFTFDNLQMCEVLLDYVENCRLIERNATEQIERENELGEAGIPLGAVYEIRYWRGRGNIPT